MENKPHTEPIVRHEHDVDDAISELFPGGCPNCRSTNTARDIPWLQYALLLVIWLVPLRLEWISAHGDRRITWFIIGLVACILAVWQAAQRLSPAISYENAIERGNAKC